MFNEFFRVEWDNYKRYVDNELRRFEVTMTRRLAVIMEKQLRSIQKAVKPIGTRVAALDKKSITKKPALSATIKKKPAGTGSILKRPAVCGPPRL